MRSSAAYVFAKISVPVGGSPDSCRGLKYATDIAKKYNAEITSLHVMEGPTYAHSVPGGIVLPAENFTGMRKHAEAWSAEGRKEPASRGVLTKTVLRRETPRSKYSRHRKDSTSS